MKKLLFALAICSLVVFALVTTVMADNGPHGSFTADTDACASCHRVHTAQYGSNSLLINDPEALCMGCHGGGAGAFTNVKMGVYGSGSEGAPGNPLFGGGFDHALMATTWSGKVTEDPSFNATSKPTTSHHELGTSGTVWGSGANNSTAGSYVLECTSCHDPHGNSGYNLTWASVPTTGTPPVQSGPVTTLPARVPTYRLLRWQPQGSNSFTFDPNGWSNVNWSGGPFPSATGVISTTNTGWKVPDTFLTLGTEWYTLGTANRFAVGDYNNGNANDAYNPTGHNYRNAAVNVAFFCAQCHDRYFNNSRSRNNTDASLFCGAPVAGVVVNGITLPVFADADGVPPWAHPTNPTVCEPVVSSTNALTGWGDNRPTGDLSYKYRHASGDVRLSNDGTVAGGAATSVSRSCVACHVAHGSSADMTAEASGATLVPDVNPVGGNSVLLRMDNRSICLRCHAGNVNFTVGP